MTAFKQFTTKDVIFTPFLADKGFNFSGSAITGSNVGINVYFGRNIPYNDPNDQDTGFVFTQSNSNVYNSAKQLYYTNYLTQSTGDNVATSSVVPGATREDDKFLGPIQSPRFENYLQSTLTQSRFIGTVNYPKDTNNASLASTLTTISIPQKLYGEKIIPTTFRFTYKGASVYNNVLITDDGDGNLISSSTNPVNDLVVGQIFYSQGIAVLTTGSNGGSALNNMGKVTGNDASPDLDNIQIQFSSSITIYESQYKCTILENEFGNSTNPTILKNSNGTGSANVEYADFATGSYFSPYVTCVGLYNENTQLVAVGKLSFPAPISQFTDTTIIVNFDQ